MTEQLAQPHSGSARRHQRPAAASPRVPGGRPAGGRPAGPRGGRAVARLQAGWVMFALPVLGALVDELLGSPLGLAFAVCTVLGSAWAALLATRPGLWWVLPMPPLVVAAITVLSQLLLHGADLSGTRLATTTLRWAVDGFPVMAFSLLAAVAALGLRRLLAHRAARPSGSARPVDGGAQVPVPRRSNHG